jgi:hypothetical protein
LLWRRVIASKRNGSDICAPQDSGPSDPGGNRERSPTGEENRHAIRDLQASVVGEYSPNQPRHHRDLVRDVWSCPGSALLSYPRTRLEVGRIHFGWIDPGTGISVWSRGRAATRHRVEIGNGLVRNPWCLHRDTPPLHHHQDAEGTEITRRRGYDPGGAIARRTCIRIPDM